jgi:eukaryotic-like serine/threonine-protein kinase
MDSTDGAVDHQLRQTRLAKFGCVLALVSLSYVGLIAFMSAYVNKLTMNRTSLPFLIAGAAFAACWALLRGAPRSRRFVRTVELTTLFVGTAACSSMALVLDLTASPDMVARTAVTYILLAYAVYVPSSARQTLVLAGLMTLPLLGSIYTAFLSWDPALHDPPAAIWRKGGKVGELAFPAVVSSAVIWGIAVAIAAGFSRTIYGLRKAVKDIQRLGQYTLEEKLGEGGMGVVYRASHAMLRRPTAIKLLLPDRAGKDDLARFEREVQKTAMLTHPNTVTVFDYGRTMDGVFYYAMELLDGASLDEIVEIDGPQPAGRVIHLLEQAAASLAEAHDAGLIHRDVKPGNILVVDRAGISDLVKVLDFGLVKDVGLKGAGDRPESALTMADTVTGTPLYIAPETVTAPATIDARADLYALGAVGYWLLTGTHVFGGKTIIEVCAHHLHSTPDRPSTRLQSPLASDLENVILACLAKRPEDRPASAHVLRDRLRACAAAGDWTNARAAQWWKENRSKLRSAVTQNRTSTAGGDSDSRKFTVTRIAEWSR